MTSSTSADRLWAHGHLDEVIVAECSNAIPLHIPLLKVSWKHTKTQWSAKSVRTPTLANQDEIKMSTCALIMLIQASIPLLPPFCLFVVVVVLQFIEIGKWAKQVRCFTDGIFDLVYYFFLCELTKVFLKAFVAVFFFLLPFSSFYFILFYFLSTLLIRILFSVLKEWILPLYKHFNWKWFHLKQWYR